MELKIKRLNKEVALPSIAFTGDAAFDLRSSEDVTLAPGQMKIIKTGIAMAIPEGFRGIIKDRSGMATKYCIETTAGVIDSGYRGEVGVVLRNHGTDVFTIEKGMRIAQMKLEEVPNIEIIEVNELDDTDRGNSGFGSSGMR